MGFLLSPAINPVCVTAAVQNGADAVYFQTAPGGARPNALNMAEARSVINYCTMRGVQSFLHICTYPTDREMAEWAVCLSDLLQHGLTGVMLRDMGVLRMSHMVMPGLPVHVAPDAGVLTVKSAKQWAAIGATHIWLPPHLSRERLAYILRHAGVDCGVTVAGDLCAGLPGHCHLHSGGRGICRQECSNPYGVDDKPDGTPLAPMSFSLHERVEDLQAMGASSFGIFGWTHGPEWTALVTRMWYDVMSTGNPPKENDLLLLKAGFHPQGLTDRAFLDQPPQPPQPPAAEDPATISEIMASLRATYENTPERQRIPVKFNCLIASGRPVGVAVKDDLGNVIKVQGAKPSHRGPALHEAEVNTQLYKLLGTPYKCVHARSRIEEGLSVSMQVIAGLRKTALEQLTQLRKKQSERKPGQFHAGVKYLTREGKPVLTVWVSHMTQLSRALAEQKPAVLYVPLMELSSGEASRLNPFEAHGVTICPWIPRGLGDHEQSALNEALSAAVSLGIKEIATPCTGYLAMLQKSGFTVRADIGGDTVNSQTLKELKRLGFKSALLSHELNLQQVAGLSHALDTELPVYGRMPLLLTEHCLMKSRKGLCNCDNPTTLVDKSGARAPMRREHTCRTGVYSPHKLFMGHRLNELGGLGLWGIRLSFVTENARECVTVAERYNGVGNFSPGEFTVGSYEAIDT